MLKNTKKKKKFYTIDLYGKLLQLSIIFPNKHSGRNQTESKHQEKLLWLKAFKKKELTAAEYVAFYHHTWVLYSLLHIRI